MTTAIQKVNTPFLDVRDFGAKGVASDDTAAVVAAIAACPAGGTVYFPVGDYWIVNTTLNIPRDVSLLGGGYGGYGAHGATIRRTGTVGTLINPAQWSQASIRNLVLTSTGHVIDMTETINCELSNLALNAGSGYWAIYAETNTFSNLYSNLHITGNPNYTANGMMLCCHSTAVCCDVAACNEGARIFNAGNSIIGGRFEVNLLAMNLGRDAANATFQAVYSTIQGVTFESNNLALQINSANGCGFSNLPVTGFQNASPNNTNQTAAMIITAATGCSFENVACNVYAPGKSSIVLRDVSNSRFSGVNATNTAPTSNTWSGPSLSTIGSGNIFDRCNIKLNTSDAIEVGIDTKTLRCHSIAGVDFLNSVKQGKNVRGIAIPVTEASTTAAIAFPPGVQGGQLGFASATATITGGAALAPGTYYYLNCAITSAGEGRGTPESSVVVSSPNNSVSLASYGIGGGSVFKRRIYRGTVSGVYDGYYELALNANNYVDIGDPFTVTGAEPPPAVVNDNSMREPDANYAVIVTPSWNTSVWITSKATTGFTINFGTAAPANATVDWFIVR